MVHPTCISAEPPQPQGGTIEDGTYVLQTFALYGSCLTTQDFADTWVVCQGHWDIGQITAAADGGTSPANANFTAIVQGTTVAFTSTCSHLVSVQATMSRGYTATPGHLRFVFPYQSGTTAVGDYVKQ